MPYAPSLAFYNALNFRLPHTHTARHHTQYSTNGPPPVCVGESDCYGRLR